MISRSSIAGKTLRKCSAGSLVHSRTFAAPASANPFVYQISDSAGVKVVTRDSGSPTTSLAVVARAGSRYETLPGLAHALQHFGFMGTSKRSALWISREVELFGGVLETSHSRENIVLKTKFLREDLPYFVELLSDVISKTNYQEHEFDERVKPALKKECQLSADDPISTALEMAHANAFHHGLGLGKLAFVQRYLTGDAIRSYASTVYTKPNIALVASGASHSEVTKYAEEYFDGISVGTQLKPQASKFYGGETRLWSSSPSSNAIVIAFQGSAGHPNFKPEFYVLSYLLAGESSIKWSPGTSILAKAVEKHVGVRDHSRNLGYSDTGLFYIALSGPADALKSASVEVINAVKSVADIKEEDIKRAIKLAKFDMISAAEDNTLSIETAGQSIISGGKISSIDEIVKNIEGVTLESVKKAANGLLTGRASVGTVGNLHILPYAEEIGLKV